MFVYTLGVDTSRDGWFGRFVSYRIFGHAVGQALMQFSARTSGVALSATQSIIANASIARDP